MRAISGWSRQVSDSEAARRAGGRRRYNLERRERAELRQYLIAGDWADAMARGDYTFFERGRRARLAEQYEVSRATITRDFAAIRERRAMPPCPLCGSAVAQARWTQLQDQGLVRIIDWRTGQLCQTAATRAAAREENRAIFDKAFAEMVGDWGPAAKVVALAKHRSVALTVVDRRGGGGSLVLSLWRLRHGGWQPELEWGVGGLEHPVLGFWPEGPAAYGVGRSPGRGEVVLRHGGRDHVCWPGEDGVWAFIRQVPKSREPEPPQLVLQPSADSSLRSVDNPPLHKVEL